MSVSVIAEKRLSQDRRQDPEKELRSHGLKTEQSSVSL